MFLGSSGGAENSCDDVIVLRNYDVIRLFSKPGQAPKTATPTAVFFIKHGSSRFGGADATSLPRRMGPIHLKWLKRARQHYSYSEIHFSKNGTRKSKF